MACKTTRLTIYCLLSYTLRREKGSGHAATMKLSPWNAIYLTQWSDDKMLTSAKHVVIYLYSATQMQAMKSTDLIGHTKVLPW